MHQIQHWIQPLADLTLADVDRVGGKAAHLGAMMRAGFPVPEGFVIDINAFVSHFGQTTDPLVKPTPPRIQPELMTDVVQALMEHLADQEQLAVRSSSTEEDSASASFAGLHSTYYFVAPNRLDQAILDCWMSLWSEAALSYRRSGWSEVNSGEPVRMAVIVQRMLPATRSGIAFSRDPVSAASSDCVIEASWGLGAALVDGRVTPDHARVSEDGDLLTYTVSDKQFHVQAGSYDARLQEVPLENRRAPVLNKDEAERIANIAHQLETLFDAPQDVEWSFEDDELYLLQTRNITTLPAYPSTDAPLVLFKPLAENFTEPLTPLSADLIKDLLPAVGAIYDGRFYIDVELLRTLSPFDLTNQDLAQAALLRPTDNAPRVDWRAAAKSAGLLALAFLADGANWMRTARVSNAGLGRYARLAERIAADDKMDAKQAARRLIWGKHPLEPIGHQMFYTNFSAGRYFIYLGALTALINRFAPEFPRDELSRTYHGREDMQSLMMLERLRELSVLLASATADDDESDAAEQIRRVLDGVETALPSDHPFTERFEAFLYEYGHRGPRELEFAAPRWRESPASLLKLLTSSPPGQVDEPLKARTHGAHLAARDRLHGHLNPWQRRLVDRLIDRISHYVALRENTRHYHVMAFDVVRAKLKRLEQALLRDGKLRLAGDIFFMTWNEIGELTRGELDNREAHARVRTRRREWSRSARAGAIETLNVMPIDAEEASPNSTEALASGQCACPGTTTGRARVLHSLNDADSLEAGEILVAPYTDPAWTPLFSRVAGIVVETGSFLSHAGTVARELHIPCIVDVKNATRDIVSGQVIELDASSGLVKVVE